MLSDLNIWINNKFIENLNIKYNIWKHILEYLNFASNHGGVQIKKSTLELVMMRLDGRPFISSYHSFLQQMVTDSALSLSASPFPVTSLSSMLVRHAMTHGIPTWSELWIQLLRSRDDGWCEWMWRYSSRLSQRDVRSPPASAEPCGTCSSWSGRLLPPRRAGAW